MQQEFEQREDESPTERIRRLEEIDRSTLSPADTADLNSALAEANRHEKEQRSPKGHQPTWLGNK
jgi:hypothetical protein